MIEYILRYMLLKLALILPMQYHLMIISKKINVWLAQHVQKTVYKHASWHKHRELVRTQVITTTRFYNVYLKQLTTVWVIV